MTAVKTLAGIAMAGASLVSGAAQAQNMAFFRIGTGSAGGTYFPIGGLLENAISNPPESRPCDKGGSCGVPGLVAIAQSTNASAHNVTAIQAGQMEAGLSGAATLYFAYHGKAKFEGKPKKKLRVIANRYPEELIYNITKAMWNKNSRRLLDNGHAKGKVITLDSALLGFEGLNVPLHPGAERFYKEVGLRGQ